MNRRLFFATLAAGLAAAADPERLFWEPGKKKIFIPPPRRWIDYAAMESVTSVEEWWKQPDGRVFRRVDGGLPELTAYKELPFWKLAPIQVGPLDVLAPRYGAGSQVQFVHRLLKYR